MPIATIILLGTAGKSKSLVTPGIKVAIFSLNSSNRVLSKTFI